MTQMVYRNLGRCGTKVSALSLGGWTTFGGSVHDDKQVKSILYAAFEAGINFFDIADIYARGEAEKVMGKVLRDFPRHELVISSKVFWPMSDDINDRGLSRKHIFESVDRSLKRIGTDYIDLYFCHRFDPETPVEETVRAMDDLVRAGKVLYWGTSEWTGDQLNEAWRCAAQRNAYAPQVEQPQYNLLNRVKFELDVAPVCDKHGMGAVVWSPLASGLLTGKYDKGIPKDSRLDKIEWLRDAVYNQEKIDLTKQLITVAGDHGVSRAALAIAWTLSHKSVSSVILGATQVDQLLENLTALNVTLEPEVIQKMNAIFAY